MTDEQRRRRPKSTGKVFKLFLLPLPVLGGRTVLLRDTLGPARYTRRGDDLLSPGLFLDLPPWGRHVFDVTVDSKGDFNESDNR